MVDGEVTERFTGVSIINPQVPAGLGRLQAYGHHVVNFFYLVGDFKYLQNNSRIRLLRMLSVALEEEIKVLDFVLWLNYYYFVLLDCFLLFLHFLTSLIKFALELREGLGG